MSVTKTQVVIVGGGPAGMLLAHMLDLSGIKSIVLEQRSRDYVLGRVRAGMLEAGTVEMLRQAGLGERLDKEAFRQEKVHFAWEGRPTLIVNLIEEVGKCLTAYGQSRVTEDLYAAHDAAGREIVHSVENVCFENLTTSSPRVMYEAGGQSHTIECEFVAGCDGFHGVSRRAIPDDTRQEWERVYPFGWLGILSEVPPLKELVYARHSDGFMLASKRNPQLSRYYVQVPNSDKIEDWSDDRFWEAVLKRLPDDLAAKVTTGPSIEKSIAPLRSFVSAPMRYGRLCLAGDAAHIVPPTGAKGLNLAASDVFYLSRALDSYFKSGSSDLIDQYSDTALKRVWSSVNLSWQLTKLLHVFPNEEPFEEMIQANQFDLYLNHVPMRKALAYEVCGLPF